MEQQIKTLCEQHNVKVTNERSSFTAISPNLKAWALWINLSQMIASGILNSPLPHTHILFVKHVIKLPA